MMCAAILILAGAWLLSPLAAQDLATSASLATRPAYSEPVVLASKNGVLELSLTAHQGQVKLDTVADPVAGALVYAYSVQQGTASDGQMSGDNSYPAPTLQVFPGEKLIVHLNNGLANLSIRDYYNPAFTAKGHAVPTYPEPLSDSPTNLHVHGLHVSPSGQSDNVLLEIPANATNTYVYDIPKSMPQGAYWYHSHLHTLTAQQTYAGMAGYLMIGHTDGNLPQVAKYHIPVRNMELQYNGVFDRADGLAHLNNLNWSQWASTLATPAPGTLANGTYRPLLAPTNFLESKKGTQYFTVWYTGPLSIYNTRGMFEFIPSNLQSFKANPGQSVGNDVPANPALPDYERDVQFTVNGEFEPNLPSKPGQTEIWVLANTTDIAYITVELTETATGNHPKLAVVGEDGNPSPAVHYPPTHDGTQLVIPSGSRFAVAVTMPKTGNLIMEMPPIGHGARTLSSRGILYTNDGTPNPPAALGTISVLPSAISYIDGFFVFPTQTLLKAVPDQGDGTTVSFTDGEKLQAYSSFVDLSRVKPDVKRKLVIGGGFLNTQASMNDPKAFVYSFDDNMFPNIPLIQPRLGSTEEWTFVNENNDEHPIHVHVNDFQVVRLSDPTTGMTTKNDMWGEDNANVPAPTMDAQGNTVTPGTMTIRTKFEDFLGTFVVHCHRLNHEDNGLMAIINVIPARSTYAVAVPGSPGTPARVKVYDGNGDRLIATVTPFPGFEGTPSVAMGDLTGDGILDLIVGAGKGAPPHVVAYSGASSARGGPFQTEIARFDAFANTARGGVSVAAALIDGTDRDDIVVGSGPGIPDQVNVYRSTLPATLGTAPATFSNFRPYANDSSGVSLAGGMVDSTSGRDSIVTAPGPGAPAQVKVFRYSLMKPYVPPLPGEAASATEARKQKLCAPLLKKGPATTAAFMPFGSGYRGGMSLAVGWVAGTEGGAKSIIAGQLAGGVVKVFSSGSRLDGQPGLYLLDPAAHDDNIAFHAIASLTPFGGSGVRVASTSTTAGADLLVAGGPTGHAEVVKYRFVRATPHATTMQARSVSRVETPGSPQASIGGD